MVFRSLFRSQLPQDDRHRPHHRARRRDVLRQLLQEALRPQGVRVRRAQHGRRQGLHGEFDREGKKRTGCVTRPAEGFKSLVEEKNGTLPWQW